MWLLLPASKSKTMHLTNAFNLFHTLSFLTMISNMIRCWQTLPLLNLHLFKCPKHWTILHILCPCKQPLAIFWITTKHNDTKLLTMVIVTYFAIATCSWVLPIWYWGFYFGDVLLQFYGTPDSQSETSFPMAMVYGNIWITVSLHQHPAVLDHEEKENFCILFSYVCSV